LNRQFGLTGADTKGKTMNKWIQWLVAHALHWAVLYGAFVAELDGAMYVLKFFVWVMAPLSLVLLADKATANSAKNPPQPVRRALGSVQAWVTLGLLVWFGHVATALAWGLVMVMVAMHREAVRKARDTATDAPAQQPAVGALLERGVRRRAALPAYLTAALADLCAESQGNALAAGRLVSMLNSTAHKKALKAIRRYAGTESL
jgi:hypothetical protein